MSSNMFDYKYKAVINPLYGICVEDCYIPISSSVFDFTFIALYLNNNVVIFHFLTLLCLLSSQHIFF